MRKAFLTLWAGQLVSLIGSGLTAFTIAIWVYQRTGSVTEFSVIALATTVPGILLLPLAGFVVDRWNRRTVMLMSDGGGVLCALGLAALLFSHSLAVWKIVALLSVASAFESFKVPAYLSILPLLVPKERLGRFNGLIQLGSALPKVLSPLLAGSLIATLEPWGIILLDCGSFVVAFVTLLGVRVPKPEPAADVPRAAAPLLGQVTEGWRYLRARSGLMTVLLFLVVLQLTIGIVNVGFPVLVLSFTSAARMGILASLLGLGLVAGSAAMSAWGGPQRRIEGILGFTLVLGLGVILSGLRPTAFLVGAGLLLIAVSAPLIAGCAQVLWQIKVPSYLHGRVFALRDMAARSSLALAFLISGPLADRMFEPLMAENGALAGSVGRVLGVGHGRGVGLMFVLFGSLSVLTAVAAYTRPRIRQVDDELPDVLERSAGRESPGDLAPSSSRSTARSMEGPTIWEV